jgi:hypothetical protein
LKLFTARAACAEDGPLFHERAAPDYA